MHGGSGRQADLRARGGLDQSAAFDVVDNSLLIEGLQSGFGVIDTALDWLRFLMLSISRDQSPSFRHCWAWRPCSTSVGTFCSLCIAARRLTSRQGFKYHQYPNDTEQSVANVHARQQRRWRHCCSHQLHRRRQALLYMQSGLQLNHDKSEVSVISRDLQSAASCHVDHGVGVRCWRRSAGSRWDKSAPPGPGAWSYTDCIVSIANSNDRWKMSKLIV